MRRSLAMVLTATLACAFVGSLMVGTAGAPPLDPSCSATAANPTADAGTTITASGTGRCTQVASVTVRVCLQAAEHTPAGTSWSNWKCNSKTPSPGTTVTVNVSAACVAGHAYQVRTRTVSTGFNGSGTQVAQKVALSSNAGVTRTCHN
jgi:hypothetical protein